MLFPMLLMFCHGYDHCTFSIVLILLFSLRFVCTVLADSSYPFPKKYHWLIIKDSDPQGVFGQSAKRQ